MSTTRIAICLFDESIKEFNQQELIVGSKVKSVPTINSDAILLNFSFVKLNHHYLNGLITFLILVH